jgi:hypothetical protein
LLNISFKKFGVAKIKAAERGNTANRGIGVLKDI